jgi:hypothetical protein
MRQRRGRACAGIRDAALGGAAGRDRSAGVADSDGAAPFTAAAGARRADSDALLPHLRPPALLLRHAGEREFSLLPGPRRCMHDVRVCLSVRGREYGPLRVRPPHFMVPLFADA